jgi:hypothetical protein
LGLLPQAAEEADSFDVLNEMLESWSLNGLMITKIVREQFPLVPGQQTYTIGVGGNFDTSRPIELKNVGVVLSGVELPVEIFNTQKWAAIESKSLQSTIPQAIFVDGSFPLDNYNIWPIPNAANDLVLYSKKVLTTFSTAGETIELPPGYARAIRYNLAMELAPEFGRDPSALVAITAKETKEEIQRNNIEPSYLTSDVFGLANRKTFNILTGE